MGFLGAGLDRASPRHYVEGAWIEGPIRRHMIAPGNHHHLGVARGYYQPARNSTASFVIVLKLDLRP